MVDTLPVVALRSSVGVELWSSKSMKFPFEPDSRFPRDESKHSRTMEFSPDGRYFAYCNGALVRLVNTNNWKEICTFPRPRTFYMKFSPLGNYLITWELFTVNQESGEGNHNLFVYRCENGEEVYSNIQKKQIEWEPSWSSDESIFGLMVGGEAVFYELSSNDGFRKQAGKLTGGRNGLVSIAPGRSPPNIGFYVPGLKGSPSMCKIYKYTNLDPNQMIAAKSFHQADNIEMLWNKFGTGLLLLTSTDVDQSGSSYYGKQNLHYLSAKGDSYGIQLDKTGPIHAVAWNPMGKDFCVVYGSMPPKASVFNLKCDIVFDFGEGPRNCIHFNNFGNLVILAGFGNMRGSVEIWDINKREKISSLQAPDTTLLEWCPNGEIFLTATTAPRLRMCNGFKVWHYCGSLLHESSWPEGQELLDVKWQKFPTDAFTEFQITKTKIDGIKSKQPEASKQVYKPPIIRMIQEGKLDEIPIIPGLPPGYRPKRKSNKKSKAKISDDKKPEKELTTNDDTKKQPINSGKKQKPKIDENINKKLSNPDDKIRIERKIVKEKLRKISQIKSKLEKGETLNEVQLAKLATEDTLRTKMENLKLQT